ncbi:hypothetical protein Droror1_Dr00009751 [Drosera rotundifolia]
MKINKSSPSQSINKSPKKTKAPTNYKSKSNSHKKNSNKPLKISQNTKIKSKINKPINQDFIYDHVSPTSISDLTTENLKSTGFHSSWTHFSIDGRQRFDDEEGFRLGLR